MAAMPFELKHNPLEQEPLFAGIPAEAPAPERSAGRGRRGPKPDPRTADYQRATFIVKKDLLKKLKERAYQERKDIKQVINEILENALNG